MNTFWLKISAPFAAFRGFQAGVYRSTAPVIPPSAAYGLVLNLAGIEMRDYSNPKTTEIRKDIQNLRLAIGVVQKPEQSSMYQQLHGYRVGMDSKTKMYKALTKGAKYQIVPVRRELLINYIGIVGVQTNDKILLNKVEKGLRGELKRNYGLPFAGDNNFLFDKIEVVDNPPEGVIWYVKHHPDDKQVRGSCRLYIGINRTDNSKTTTDVFVPKENLSIPLPDNAWVWTPKMPKES